MAAVLAAVLLLSCGCGGAPERQGAEAGESAGQAQSERRASAAPDSAGRAATRSAAPAAETAAAAPSQPAAPGRGQELQELQAWLQENCGSWQGDWSVTVAIPGEGLACGYREREPMTAASLIKLWVAGSLCDAVQEGEADEALLDRMDVMLSKSDNDACNELIDDLGMERINGWIRQEDSDALTRLGRRMLEEGPENLTDTAECAAFLQEVLEGKCVSEKYSGRILTDLREQERRSKIPAGLPQGVECANKTGELPDRGVENDAAIVFAPAGSYILCVMSRGAREGEAQARIREVSSEVYARIGE